MRYLREVLKKNRGLTVLYVAIGVCASFLVSFTASYFQTIVDGLTAKTLALGSILLYGAAQILHYFVNYLDNYASEKLENNLFLDFKLLALKKLGRIDYQAYQGFGTGALVQRIETGAQAAKGMIFDFWLRLFRELLPTIFFSIFFIWRLNRTITCVILGGYLVIFIVTNLLLKSLYRVKEKVLVNEEKLNHFLVRGFMEMTVFRLSRRFPREVEKAGEARDEIVGSKIKLKLVHEAFFVLFAILVALLDVGLLIYAWAVPGISVGALVALIGLIGNAYTPIAIFNVLYVQYKLDRASYRRLGDFLDAKDDPGLESGYTVPALTGDIRVEGLCFRYGEREIFHGLSLHIRPGERVAFVGESGSGKSTLMRLLTGFLKYDGGSIAYDGLELNTLCLDDLYTHISYLPQDPPVFDGTLRENLVFDQDAEDEKLLEALDKARLTPLLKTMEKGLDTPLGERGIILSGGEKQRLALARLWFESREITILDEATSAMDNLTEEAVMDEVLSLLQGRTLIAIAHRLSSIVHFDRIIVLLDGRIAGEGTFEELMANNSYFARLYRAQQESE